MGVAPVVPDGDLVLGESGAIVEYTHAKYGPGGLTRGPADADFVHCWAKTSPRSRRKRGR